MFAGEERTRFVSNSPGLPARKVISTPFIGTRSRGNNTECGLGVEYHSSLAGNTEFGHVFVALETSNPKEYLRALSILNRMERIDLDILESCAHAGKKRVGRDDHSFHLLKKYQPAQIEVILEKRAVVFEQTLDQESITAIIDGFLECGFKVNNPLVHDKITNGVANYSKEATSGTAVKKKVSESLTV